MYCMKMVSSSVISYFVNSPEKLHSLASLRFSFLWPVSRVILDFCLWSVDSVGTQAHPCVVERMADL